MRLVAKNISNVHPLVRGAVLDAALAQGITISDVVGETISLAWEMPYEFSGSRAVGVESNGSDQFVVRIPQEMATRIYLISRSRGLTESSVVQELLADRFGVEYIPVKRGGTSRRKKEAAS